MRPLQLWTLSALRDQTLTAKEIQDHIEDNGGVVGREQLGCALKFAQGKKHVSSTMESSREGNRGKQLRWKITPGGRRHLDHVVKVATAVGAKVKSGKPK